MTAARPVLHGTAETLARVHHVRQLTDALPDAHELDPAIAFLIGPVDDHRQVLAHIGDDLDQLWSLLTADYDDDQLDEIPEAVWTRHSFATCADEVDHRLSATVARLTYAIEAHIAYARLVHAQHGNEVAA